MSKPATAPLKLAATIHKTLTKEGYPFTGLLQQGETPLAFANGFVDHELTNGTVRFQLLENRPLARQGRPVDVEKRMALGMAYQAYISQFGHRAPLSKERARKRLMPIFGYGSSDAVKTALKRGWKQVAAYRKTITQHLVSWDGENLNFCIEAEQMSFAYVQDADVKCMFKGWLWIPPNARATYGTGNYIITTASPEDALAIVRRWGTEPRVDMIQGSDISDP